MPWYVCSLLNESYLRPTYIVTTWVSCLSGTELIESLEDPDPVVRRYAARALGQMGPAAIDSVPNLTKLLEDEAANIRMIAALAMVNIAPDNDAPVDVLSKHHKQ